MRMHKADESENRQMDDQETGEQETVTGDEPVEELSEEQIYEDLLGEIDNLRSKVEEEHGRYLRALADFSNYKRRMEERESTLRQFASRELVLKLLPIIDDFERALASSEENRSFDALHNGLEMTLRKFIQLLEAEGVAPIEAVGEEFDPMLHEAVMRVEDGDHPDNTVVQELQKGYKMGEEVIRPSRVCVAVSED